MSSKIKIEDLGKGKVCERCFERNEDGSPCIMSEALRNHRANQKKWGAFYYLSHLCQWMRDFVDEPEVTHKKHYVAWCHYYRKA